MSERTKYYGGFALAVISIMLFVGITFAIIQPRPVEIDTTGWSQEKIELLERWMK